MTTRNYIVGAVGALAVLAAGCGTNTDCGPGTVKMNGACVPAADACGDNATFNEATGKCEGSACAAGTTLTNGECVPDGSVICGDGTSYDQSTGNCVPDISECAAGTVLVGDQCVPYDDAVGNADVEEMPEPNDFPDANAGQFTMPAEDGMVTIHGCVTPTEDADGDGNLDPDFDAYYVQASGPTLLEITVNGLNGLAGGFEMLSGDKQLSDDGWERIGVNLVNDVGKRQVYLPKAGLYGIGITDSRSIAVGGGAGGPNTCYFATVKRLAIPSPTAITNDTASGTLDGTVHFYSYPASQGDLIFYDLDAPGQNSAGALVAQVNTAYRTSSGYNGFGAAASVLTGGHADSDTITVAVDSIINYALSPVPWTLNISKPPVQALPTDGSSTTVTTDPDFDNFLYFDVANAGDMVHMQLDQADGYAMYAVLYESGGSYVGGLCVAGTCSDYDEWFHAPVAGTYYLRLVMTEDPAPTAYDVTSTVSETTPTALAVDTPVSGATLSNDLADWYVLDISASDWLAVTSDPSNLTGNLVFTVYDAGQTGVIDSDFGSIDDLTFANATDEFGRIVRGQTTTELLVRITDDGTPSGGETYDLSVANRVFTDLGTFDGTDINNSAISLAADGVNYYLIDATRAGTSFEITATPDGSEDLVIDQLDATEATTQTVNDGAGGAAETLEALTGSSPNWVALAITEAGGASGSYALDVTGTLGVNYTVTPGTLTFTSVCPGNGGSGTVHTTLDDGSGYGDDDEGLSETPIDLSGLTTGFSLYGFATNQIIVSTNGWMTFDDSYSGDAAYSPSSIPNTGDPNALVAPLWADDYMMTICTQVESDKVTVEWDGFNLFDEQVQMQVVIHDGTNAIDFIYGPNHVALSSDGVVGIEHPAGVIGEVIGNFASGVTDPGTSYTLTPM